MRLISLDDAGALREGSANVNEKDDGSGWTPLHVRNHLAISILIPSTSSHRRLSQFACVAGEIEIVGLHPLAPFCFLKVIILPGTAPDRSQS
jgi:hypothetical protein